MKRSLEAGLAVREGAAIVPHTRNLEEFLVHGMKYVFVPERGRITRGMPTARAASPLDRHLESGKEPPPVWPDAHGTVRGSAFSPTYKLAPDAARHDPALYEMLALVDAIRGGEAREQEIATRLLRERLGGGTPAEAGEMNTSDVMVIGEQLTVSRRELERLAKRFHIKHLSLFGSAARNELLPESDIDLLVEFEAGRAPSLGGMVKLKDALSALFGNRPVDLATPSILENPYRRRAIERDMEELYAA